MTDSIHRHRHRFGLWVALCAMLLAGAASPRVAVSAEGGVASWPSPPVPEGARAESGRQEGRARLEARLLVHPEWEQAANLGRSVPVGVLFNLAPGWHVYWRNPGESGLPTRLAWSAPGAAASPTAWPVPERFAESEGLFTTYGYSSQVLLTTELDFGGRDPDGALVEVEADLLICKIECIPAPLSLARKLERDEFATPGPAGQMARTLFSEYGARVPGSAREAGIELASFYAQRPLRPGDEVEAAVVATCVPEQAGAERCAAFGELAAAAQFFPDSSDVAEWRFERVDFEARADNGSVRLAAVLRVAFFESMGSVGAKGLASERLRGVLVSKSAADGRLLAFEVDLPVDVGDASATVEMLGSDWFARSDAEATPAARGASRESVSLLYALVLAFLGGMLLNCMPCVLPVLAIKIFGIAEMAQRHRREVLGHAAAYTAGILATLLALALVVLGLRSAGHLVGWGFQFQEPLFVAVVTAVVVAFGLNLFGVFEIELGTGSLSQVGRGSMGYRRSFFDGLLGVVLATPCSAPFLGTAVGFAFASSGFAIIATFLAIGLGLAFPFVFVSLLPGTAKWMPKSGMWMVKLKNGLGFALLATAVWLLWVYGRAVGLDGMIALAAFLVAMSFGLWLYGLVQESHHPMRTRIAAVAVLGISILGINGLEIASGESTTERRGATGGEGASQDESWLAFDRDRLVESVEAGAPAFVYFTADWCLTCKVNEKLVLSDERVRVELDRLGMTSYRGDWTHRNEAIRSELARFGKAGVPLYLVYAPGRPDEPAILPEVLTVDLLIDALRRAAAESS